MKIYVVGVEAFMEKERGSMKLNLPPIIVEKPI
jgi:hypothetical protein